MDGSDFPLLVVVLRRQLTLALLESSPGELIRLNDTKYKCSSSGDVNGFYDWILNDNECIVGLRFALFSDDSDVLYGYVAMLNAEYIVLGEVKPQFTVCFSDNRNIDSFGSIGGEFGGNYLALSYKGERLITFGTGAITNVQLESLRHINAHWIG